MTLQRTDFSLTREIAARPDILWHIWSDATLKRQWLSANDAPEWRITGHTQDFRIGGAERTVWQAEDPGKPWHGTHENATTYLDIAPGNRIVMAYSMAMNGACHSAVLASAEFAASDNGTTLIYSEQIMLYPDSYGVDDRRAGWTRLLEKLAEQATATA